MSTAERCRAVLLLFFYFPGLLLFGQKSAPNPEEALELYNGEDYYQAYLIYQELVEGFPKDADYRYYAGICLYNVNNNLEQALQHLKFATRYKVPVNGYYYLGRIYHNLYNFDEAVRYYEKYSALASKKELKQTDITQLIEMAKNGKGLTKSSLILQATFRATLRNQDIDPIVKNTQINNRFYIIDNKKSRKEIVSGPQAEHLPGSVNTPFDEGYCYFDSGQNTLYFSSKGHNSMGGYDVFSSVYSETSKSWSEATNMGFPVNSPFDEILYKSDGITLLATNRTLPIYSNQFMVYELDFNAAKTHSLSSVPDSIRELANLALYSKKAGEKLKNNHKPSKRPENKLSFESKNVELTYNDLIKQALGLQFKADSLMREAAKRRGQLKETVDKTLRNQLFRDIRLQEAGSSDLQRQADSLYAQASAMENHTVQALNDNKYIKLDTIIHDIKVYHFIPEEIEKAETNKENEKTGSENLTADEPINLENISPKVETARPSAQNKFQILDRSPYSSSNPIPQDEKTPAGVIYKIQMGVFSNPVDYTYFGGIYPLSGETMKERGLLKYYSGIFDGYKDAEEALSKVKVNGFADAFIVAFYDGQKISVDRARELETRP